MLKAQLWKARVGCGSPISAKICEIIVIHFKMSISQCQIAENVYILHLIQIFRELCLRNHHASVTNITTWTWEYFGKQLNHSIVHHCIQKDNNNCITQGVNHSNILCRNSTEGPELTCHLDRSATANNCDGKG